MTARVTAFVVWAAVAAGTVFWLLRLVSSSPTAPTYTVTVAAATTPRGDLARVLGAPPQQANAAALPTEPALASRFKLLGVAAPRQGGDQVGLALIAVDGKPARGYPVGATIDGSMVLQSVHPRGAALGAPGAPAQVTLELPPLPVATPSARPPGASPAPSALPNTGAQPPGAGPAGTVGAAPPLGASPAPPPPMPGMAEAPEQVVKPPPIGSTAR
ncbi:MAG TPA: type II secretion system protein N [Burkholderiaceae bacterium]|jgi:general secretion pathway protein C|nr:type II secretion system protein N [Burkholderiaceae bacterium]